MAGSLFHPPTSPLVGQPTPSGTPAFEGFEGGLSVPPSCPASGNTSTFEGYEGVPGTPSNFDPPPPHPTSPGHAAEWPEPQPLGSELQPVASLTPEHLPNALVPFVGDIAERMQCQPDFVAAAMLTALGSVIGTRLAIRPKRNDEWLVRTNLWCMIVGRPGIMKSPAVSEAINPLMRLETAARRDFDRNAHARAVEVDIYKARRKAYEEKLKKVFYNNPNASVQIDAPTEPPTIYPRRFVVNDATYEKLGEIAARNKHGILVHRDELMSLLIALDREENIAARSLYLTGWDGNQSYTFDRITRDQTYVDPLCLSVLGTTQPGRLTPYINKIQKGGGADDGLLQRFGLIIFPDQSETWRFVDRASLDSAREQIDTMFAWIANTADISRLEPIFDRSGRAYLTYSDDALLDYVEWSTRLEYRVRGKDLPPAFESHLAKYRKLGPALSLIYHIAEGGTGPVSRNATRKAFAYVDYLETHAQRAYSAGFNMGTTAAKLISNRLKNGDLTNLFTLRDIHQKGWSGLTDREQIQAGLEKLCDADWLRDNMVATGGRPKTVYTINPRIFAC